MPPKRKAAALDDDETSSTSTTTTTNTALAATTTITSNDNNKSTTNTTTTTTTTASSASTSTTNGNTIDKYIIPTTSDSKQIIWQYRESEFEPWKDIKGELLEPIEKLYQKNTKDDNEQIFDNITIIFSEMKMFINNDNVKAKKSIKRILRIPIWSWEKGRGEFTCFQPDLSFKIETSFLKGLSKASISAERYINFSTFEQARFDDDTKTRRVRRNHIDVTEIQNQSWFYLSSVTDKSTKQTTHTWELFNESLDIDKSYKHLIEKGGNPIHKISDDESVCLLTMSLIKKGNTNNVHIKRDVGPVTAIKRSYSQLSEDEKRVMINQMLSGKVSTSNGNDSTNASNKKLKVDSTSDVNNGNYLPGELDVLSKDKPMKYILRPSRHLTSTSQGDAHFRLAESQFYRLLSSGSSLKVTKVEYVCNPKLTKLFNDKMKEFKALKYEHSDPVFGFHGTAAKNIIPICTNNFQVPGGSSGVKHATDSGWYGKGIYFSEFTDYSIGYIKDCTKILLCKVLLGKPYKCSSLIHGKPCVTGYTSHLSPDEKELVIFSPAQILPVYIVHYANANAIGGLGGTTSHITEFNQANAIVASNVLSGVTISLLGTLSTVQYNIQSLITKHGGSFHSHTSNVSGCTHLVTTKVDHDNQGLKVQNAQLNNIPIINEAWLYRSIIENKLKKPSSFGFNILATKTKTETLKPIPLEQLEYDDESDDESDEEEEKKKKKPECKYGDKCYRKSADHFKEFSHSFLID